MGESEPAAPRFLAAGLSEKGRRDSNEDAAVLAVLAPPSALRAFAVLSDGMGGHNAGEVASRITIEILRAKIQAFAARPGAAGLPAAELEAEVRAWIEEVNRTIFERGRASAEQKGMGATVAVALALADGRLVAANVGDSRIYLVSGLGVRQLSVDHTAIAEQRRAFGSDSVAPEDDSGNPFAHALTKSLGQEKTIDPSVRADLALGAGDVVLLTTDGVTDVLEAERFLTVLETSATLQEAASEIHRLALDAGSKDNISVALVSNGTPASLGAAKKTTNDAAPPAAAPEEPKAGRDEEDEEVLVAGAAFGPADAPAPPPRRGRAAALVLSLLVLAAGLAAVFVFRRLPSNVESAQSAGPGSGSPATAVASAPPVSISPAPLPTPEPHSPSKENSVASAPASPSTAPPPAQAPGGATASAAAPAAARPAPRPAKGPAEPSFREPSALAGLKPLEYPPTATETPTATPTPTPLPTATETPTPVVSPAPAKPGAAKSGS